MKYIPVFLSAVFFVIFSEVKAVVPNEDTTARSENADTTKIKHWTYKALYTFGLNQMAFTNWAAGGESSLSAKAGVDYELKYTKNRLTFDHTAKLAFGMVGYIDKHLEKTDDRIDLLFSLSHKVKKKWDITALLVFKSQFANGYKYPDDSTLISTFMAPGYITLSFGFNYKPVEGFQLFMSPLAGKLTIVVNDELANKGAYGVKKAVVDTNGIVLVPGDHYYGMLGMNILTSYRKRVFKNTHISTTLNLYNNYIDPDVSNRWNIDIDWDNRLIFTINKFMATILYFHLKYDDDAVIPTYKDIDGEKVKVSEGPKLQFKESLGLTLKYKI
jgi:hypothetical protein